jgi:hypothetical protein
VTCASVMPSPFETVLGAWSCMLSLSVGCCPHRLQCPPWGRLCLENGPWSFQPSKVEIKFRLCSVNYTVAEFQKKLVTLVRSPVRLGKEKPQGFSVPSTCSSCCTSWQILPVPDTHECQVHVQNCKLIAVPQGFPSGVAQTPLDFKLHVATFPSVGCNLFYEPFGIIWSAEIVWVRISPVGKQEIIIGVVRVQEADMETLV